MTETPFNAWSGPSRIISSGQVSTFMGHSLILRVDDHDLCSSVEFTFGDDGGEFNVTTAKQTDGWVFHVINCRTTDGRGTSKPVLLAETDHELLFLHFRVFLFGSTPDHTVHYTFFGANKAAVGWRSAPG